MWDTSKSTSKYIMGVPERKEKGAGRISEETVAQNFSNLIQDMNLHIQEAQQTSGWINSKRCTL